MAECCTGESKVYVGDIGTKIVLDVCEDITASTKRELHVKKPSGAEVIWTAGLEGTTAMAYFVQALDLDEAGWYRVQGYVEMPGWRGHADTTKFRVFQSFD
jgi:hypothetical protein